MNMSNDEKERKRHEAEERVYARLKPTLTCPVCGTMFSWVQYRSAISMKCPGCQTRLRVSKSYLQGTFVLYLAIAAVAFYAIRVNILMFLLLLVITSIPISGLLAWIAGHVYPPSLRVDDDPRL
jgi:uncharacterized paraquat-inducible protein A